LDISGRRALKEVVALRHMSAQELQAKNAELFGKEV
jgi:hypothetical protein